MVESRRECVGPHLDEGGEDDHAEQTDDTERHRAAIEKRHGIAHFIGPDPVGDGSGVDDTPLLPAHVLLDAEGHHGGQEEQDAHGGPHGEVLLPDHLLVDVRGEHVVVAPHHLWSAEIRKGEDEGDDEGVRQAVLDAGERHRPKFAQTVRPEGFRRLVETVVRSGEGDQEDEKGLGKGVDDLREDDAHGTVEPDAQPQGGEESLVAEEIDHADAVHHGRREEGQKDHVAKEGPKGHVRPADRVGVAEGEGDGPEGGDGGDVQRVKEGGEKVGS